MTDYEGTRPAREVEQAKANERLKEYFRDAEKRGVQVVLSGRNEIIGEIEREKGDPPVRFLNRRSRRALKRRITKGNHG